MLNPDTGAPADDSVRVNGRIASPSDDDKRKLFQENAIRIFPLFRE